MGDPPDRSITGQLECAFEAQCQNATKVSTAILNPHEITGAVRVKDEAVELIIAVEEVGVEERAGHPENIFVFDKAPGKPLGLIEQGPNIATESRGLFKFLVIDAPSPIRVRDVMPEIEFVIVDRVLIEIARFAGQRII